MCHTRRLGTLDFRLSTLSRRARRGLTLLELVLALALSVVILSLVSLAIDLHLRMLDTRRTDVEEAKIARAVLRMMADDLRGALQYESFDDSGVPDVLAAGENALSGGLGDALGDELEGMEDLIGGAGGETQSEQEQDIQGATSVPPMPGLYGNQYEIEIDVSRLPRVDQYRQFQSADAWQSPTDIPSDVKTVAYYMRSAQGPDAMAFSSSGALATGDVAASTGLVRREADRAVTLFAANSGSLSALDAMAEVIAPEVTWIEFRYYDGREWWTEWNSDYRGGLPMAVEIAIAVEPLWQQAEQGSSLAMTDPTSADPSLRQSLYRMVVRIPAAVPVPPPGSATDEVTGQSGSQVLGTGETGGTGGSGQENTGNN